MSRIRSLDVLILGRATPAGIDHRPELSGSILSPSAATSIMFTHLGGKLLFYAPRPKGGFYSVFIGVVCFWDELLTGWLILLIERES